MNQDQMNEVTLWIISHQNNISRWMVTCFPNFYSQWVSNIQKWRLEKQPFQDIVSLVLFAVHLNKDSALVWK